MDRETLVETRKIALLFGYLIAAPIAANAASVTYDFTGTVTTATGSYSGDTGTVTGTITINIANANPAQSTLPVSLSSTWVAQEYTGSEFGTTPSGAYVFSDTVSVGGVHIYSTPGPGAYESLSYVDNASGGYEATENQYLTPSSAVGSNIYLYGANTYTSAGVPTGFALNAGNSNDSGAVEATGGSQLDYTITSLTPVPLPAATWLMLSGLGGIGVFARKKRAA